MFSAKIRNSFFDPSPINKRASERFGKAMARIGGYVRTTAARSMRRRKTPSAPGSPPSARAGQIRNLMAFAVLGWRNVIVGPKRFQPKRGAAAVTPRLHEEGGQVREPGSLYFFRRKRRKSGQRPFQAVFVRGVLRYAERPFMQPALQITKSKFAQYFANILG